ncbi:MAG: hypothetical protein ACK5KL_05295 [Dysgonomonas sp.]
MTRLFFSLLFIFCINSLYAQDKKVYLPKGERHPYYNKFTYVLDDDADHYFLAKAYRLLGAEQDISIDFLLFNLEKEDVYKFPLPKDSVYQTEPMLSNNPQNGYEYTILWENGDKSYTLSASNKYKESQIDVLGLFFKGLTLLIEKNTENSQIKKEAVVKCHFWGYEPYFEFMNENETAYLVPPTIKPDKQRWLWFKDYERYIYPYVECRVNSVEDNYPQKEFNIFIRDYFRDGFTGIPTEQTLDITGNSSLANRYLKKHHIRIRETSYSRKLIEESKRINIDFDSIQPIIRRVRQVG